MINQLKNESVKAVVKVVETSAKGISEFVVFSNVGNLSRLNLLIQKCNLIAEVDKQSKIIVVDLGLNITIDVGSGNLSKYEGQFNEIEPQ